MEGKLRSEARGSCKSGRIHFIGKPSPFALDQWLRRLPTGQITPKALYDAFAVPFHHACDEPLLVSGMVAPAAPPLLAALGQRLPHLVDSFRSLHEPLVNISRERSAHGGSSGLQ